MNTRLQVEHGINKLVNHIDLVEWTIQLSLKDYRHQFKYVSVPKIQIMILHHHQVFSILMMNLIDLVVAYIYI